MIKIIKYSLFALIVYLLSLLMLFPADRAYSLVRDRFGLSLELYQVSGSVWDGHVGRVRAATVSIDDIDWCLHILPLLAGRIELGLTIAGTANPIQLVVGRYLDGSFYVHDDGQGLPLTELESLLNPQPLGLKGTVMLDLDDIRMVTGGRLSQVNGNVVWLHAGLGDPVNIDVGDLAATVSTKDDVVQAMVKDQGGPLAVDGQIMLMPDSTYRLTMTLMVKDNSRTDLKQSLRLLGTPGRDGKVSVSRRGRLNLG